LAPAAALGLLSPTDCLLVHIRVAQDGAFLLLLYTRGQHVPHMYEWRLTPSFNLGRATNFPLQLFTSALELPLSALRSDRDAAPFQFLFRQKDAGMLCSCSRVTWCICD
jgi:hypothetical protein